MSFSFCNKARRSQVATSLLIIALFTGGYAAIVPAAHASSEQIQVASASRHPKLRKWGKVAAIGALTGGIGGVILGGSILTHAVVGAGVRSGVTAAREHHKAKKARELARDHGHNL